MIIKLWIDADLILIFYAKNAYSTVPFSQIPRDALDYMVVKVKEAGGEILDCRK